MSVPIATALTEAVARAQQTEYRQLGPRFTVQQNARQAAILMLFGAQDDTASGGPDDFSPDELDIVLEVRADTLRAHPGEVSFPGGGRDAGDPDIEFTALREAQEEIGLDPADAIVLGSLAETGTVSAFRVTPVVAWRTRATTFTAMDPGETAAVHRVAVSDLLDPERRFTTVYRHPTGDFRGPGFEIPDAVVWGFTAFVLDEFFTLAGWTREWDRSRERDI